MTPTHSGKSSKTRRYRYYVTRPDLVDGSPVSRVSVHDLEQLVCSALAEKLGNPSTILDLLGETDVEPGVLQQAMAHADLAAATLRSGAAADRHQLIEALVERIDVSQTSIGVALRPRGLLHALGIEEAPACEAPLLQLEVPVSLVRRGHQLRLVVPGPAAQPAPAPPRRDEPLIALVAEAFRARELVLANAGRSILSIAREHGRCRTRLAALVGLSCLAPDVVTAIVEGRQPRGLTAKRLRNLELPLAWDEQRRLLGFAGIPAAVTKARTEVGPG